VNASAASYIFGTSPGGSVELAIASGTGAMTMVRLRSAVRIASGLPHVEYESRASTTAVNTPNAVAIPAMVPSGFSVNPGGSSPDTTDHVTAPT
jgi:hypothetical protein